MARLDLGRRDDGTEGVRRRLVPLVGHLPHAAQRPGLLAPPTGAGAGPPVPRGPAAEGQEEQGREATATGGVGSKR